MIPALFLYACTRLQFSLLQMCPKYQAWQSQDCQKKIKKYKNTLNFHGVNITHVNYCINTTPHYYQQYYNSAAFNLTTLQDLFSSWKRKCQKTETVFAAAIGVLKHLELKNPKWHVFIAVLGEIIFLSLVERAPWLVKTTILLAVSPLRNL